MKPGNRWVLPWDDTIPMDETVFGRYRNYLYNPTFPETDILPCVPTGEIYFVNEKTGSIVRLYNIKIG